VGAYVRLSEAGLGCPDWPGCYGAMSPAHAEADIARAVAAQGGDVGPVSMHKAWKEMVHRYLAGTLGLLIAALAVAAWRWRAVLGRARVLATALVALVLVQAALGMWTVTLLLKPVVVTLHLLGGMATMTLLVWLSLRELEPIPQAGRAAASAFRVGAAIGLAVVAGQIALGGWVSSNYASLACIDFPKCHNVWRPEMDFQHGFQLVRELGKTSTGGPLAYQALTAIHWTHRVGALITLLYLGSFVLALGRVGKLRPYGITLALVLGVQIALGVSNIVRGLPLAVAVAHNAVAALLLATMVVINFALSRASSRSSS